MWKERSKMVRELTFIKKNGKRIRGEACIPEGSGRYPVVIFCHGFGGDFRGLAHHGEGFAKEGICCLFFDFCGGGRNSLSDGAMEEMTVMTECEDLEEVIEYVKALDYVDREQIFLQGESMGGLVSALTAAKRAEDIRALVLWYPAFIIPEDAAKRYQAGGGEVFGIPLGRSFDQEAKKIDVYHEIGRYTKPVLIIHGDKDPVAPLRYSERALTVYPNAKLIVMRGAGHGYDGEDSAAAGKHSISFIKEHCGRKFVGH